MQPYNCYTALMNATSENTYHYVISSFWGLCLGPLSWLMIAALTALGSRRTFPYFWNREFSRTSVSPSTEDDGDLDEEPKREAFRVAPFRPSQARDLLPSDTTQRRQPGVLGLPPTDKFNRAPTRNETAGRQSWEQESSLARERERSVNQS